MITEAGDDDADDCDPPPQKRKPSNPYVEFMRGCPRPTPPTPPTPPIGPQDAAGSAESDLQARREQQEREQQKARERLEWEQEQAREKLRDLGFSPIRPGATVAAKKWIVDKFIGAGDSVGLIGLPKAGKSSLARSLATAVADVKCIAWCGHPVLHGGVLYIATQDIDGARRGLEADRRRVNAPAGLPIEVLPGRPDLRNPAVIGSIFEYTRAVLLPRWGILPKLVIVDIYADAIGDGDENTTRDAVAAFAGLAQLRGRMGVATLLLHHTPRNSPDQVRGSNVFDADVAPLLVMRRRGEVSTVTIKFDREGHQGLSHSFALKTVDVDGKPTGVLVDNTEASAEAATEAADKPRMSKAGEIALKAFDDVSAKDAVAAPAHLGLPAGTLVVPTSAWRAQCYRLRISESSDHRAQWKAFDRGSENLSTFGLVVSTKDWAWRPATPRTPPDAALP